MSITTLPQEAAALHFEHAYLISDLHLEVARPAMTAILERFLEGRARCAPALFLLGDIFEVWVGDDDDDALLGQFASLVSRLTRSGVLVFFMHGNRDILVGEHFAKRAGMQLIADPTVVNLGGVRTVLAHGDALYTEQIQYQTFRRMARTPAWQAQILAMPLADRRILGRTMRNTSIEVQREQAAAGAPFVDVDEAACAALVDSLAGARLIHGHTHQPATHQLPLRDGRIVERIVLSDWSDTRGEALEVCTDGTVQRHELT